MSEIQLWPGREKIFLNPNQKIYIVITCFRQEGWGIANFWGLPYSSIRKSEALSFKREIMKKATKYDPKIWKQKDFKVLKIQFS